MATIMEKRTVTHISGPGVQESDYLDRLPVGQKIVEGSEGIQLVSLGCHCGVKLSFKKMGLGAATLPFDWTRSTLSGVLHFLTRDFQGFFDYGTRIEKKAGGKPIFRGYHHAFWHDDPDDPFMRERYTRRFSRFQSIDGSAGQVLFVRAVASTDEVPRAVEVLQLLQERFGQHVYLLLIIDFQKRVQGASLVDGHPNLIIYSLGGDAHNDSDSAPYCKPVEMALNMLLHRKVTVRHWRSLIALLCLLDPTSFGLYDPDRRPAFETLASANGALAVEAAIPGVGDEPLASAGDELVILTLANGGGPVFGDGAGMLPDLDHMMQVSQRDFLDWLRSGLTGYFYGTGRADVMDPGRRAYRSCTHCFWAGALSAGQLERSRRRRTRQLGLATAHHMFPVLVVRAVATVEELLEAERLMRLVKGFGKQVLLVLLVVCQGGETGAFSVEGNEEDLFVYMLDRADQDGRGMPHAEAIAACAAWARGDELEVQLARSLPDLYLLAHGP